ncbi:MAG: hypothetical protein AAFY36_06885 [Bacteroidota bacterium]
MPISPQQIKDWRDAIAQQDRLEQVVESLGQTISENDVAWLSSWRNPAISLQSDYRANEQMSISGERSPAEYAAERAKLRRRTLDLLDELAAKRPYTNPVTRPPSSSTNKWLYIGLPLVGVLALAWWLWPTPSNPPSQATNNPPLEEESLCPEFLVSSDFRAMVLPYDAARAENRNPSLHNRVNGILQKFAEDYDLNIESRAVTLDIDEINEQSGYPGGPADADRLGQECLAQLVIWGYTEKTNDNNNLTVTEYRFVESPSWQFSEYQLDENLQVATASTFTEIVASGQLTTGIEQALRLIFGLVARNMHNNKATIALLENHPVAPDDLASYELQQLALAEAYHNEDRDTEAEQAYTDLIAQDSSNLIAWRNRGTLRYYQEDYIAAAADMSTVLAYEPEDEQARYTRTLANLKTNRLYEAEADLIRLNNDNQVATPETGTDNDDDPDTESSQPPAEVQNHRISTEQMRVLSREWETSKDRSQGFRDAGRSALQNNSTDVEQLSEGMRSAYYLHDFDLAAKLAERVSELQPDRVEAYQIAADSYLLNGQESNANRVMQKAETRGIRNQVQLQSVIRAERAIQLQPATRIQLQEN